MAAREAAAATAGSGNGSVEHWRRSKRAGVETIGARERVILLRHLVGCGKGPLARVGHLDERGAAPTGLELLGRGAYVPRFLSPNPPFYMYVRRHGRSRADFLFGVRGDMVHFDARLDTWAHVRSPGCGSRVVLYVSILQLAHELLAQNCLVSTWLT